MPERFRALSLSLVALPLALAAGAAAGADGRDDDAEAAARQQRAARIAQHAKQLEPVVRPFLEAELELVRRTCGSLPADTRPGIVVAGTEAIPPIAARLAARRLGERGEDRIDALASIHEAVAAAVRRHAAPEEFATYEREHAARVARRARTARTLILMKLDQELELSGAQRDAIEADLGARWEAAWLRELDDNGFLMVNNRRPAPDFAAACITPHLDERQHAKWREWCEQAAFSRLAPQMGWNLDSTSLPPDPWWSP